jgi:hypothetical protein
MSRLPGCSVFELFIEWKCCLANIVAYPLRSPTGDGFYPTHIYVKWNSFGLRFACRVSVSPSQPEAMLTKQHWLGSGKRVLGLMYYNSHSIAW